MSSWRTKQQFKYLIFVVGIVLTIIAVILFFSLNRPGSCFDGVKNNDETGIDCGGSCSRICPFEVSEIVVNWSRALKVREGVYDVAAFLENPNFDAGIKKVSYSFKLYDAKNVLTGEREGSTYINPGERFVIYESGIETGVGTRVPRRTFFEFEGELAWVDKVTPRESEIIARDTSFELPRQPGGGSPKVKTTLISRATKDIRNLDVVALLFDEDENLIDASRTIVSRILSGESKDITILLSPETTQIPDRVDIFSRRNMFK